MTGPLRPASGSDVRRSDRPGRCAYGRSGRRAFNHAPSSLGAGDGMNVVAVLGTIAMLVLFALVGAGVRQRTMVSMAIRNIGRARSEAIRGVAGALLGTAIIT